jgi:hypothetical protein
MGYKRITLPAKFSSGESLTEALVGIGMNLAHPSPDKEPNIEDTLIAASIEGMEKDDFRALALLVTWLEVHHPWVNADRLIRMAKEQSPRVKAFWSSIAHWLAKDQRFVRLQKIYKGKRIDLMSAGTDFQVNRRGEDQRFEGSPLRIPARMLRDRKADILTPKELATRHHGYHYRVLIGPTYRADMWAALEKNSELSSAEIARLTYGSFATAWSVKKDFKLLQAV